MRMEAVEEVIVEVRLSPIRNSLHSWLSGVGMRYFALPPTPFHMSTPRASNFPSDLTLKFTSSGEIPKLSRYSTDRVMLKFIIIWSAANKSDDFHVS